MMLQIARGVEYLHEQSIVHRDLNSNNIFVAPSEIRKLRQFGYAEIKISDFGLAEAKVDDLERPTLKIMVTTERRSPGASAADLPLDWKTADAYSFAMICSEMFTGKTTFSSARVTRNERPKLPSYPEALASLLEACWHTWPSSRPSFTEIIETRTSVKRDLLEFQWNDPYPGKAYKKLVTLQGLR